MTQPLYQQIADEYQRIIHSGALKRGDRFPSIRHIMQTQQVSMSTAVQACHVLEDWGLLRAKARAGYFVEDVQAHKQTTSPSAASTATTHPTELPEDWAKRYDGLHQLISQWLAEAEQKPVHIDFMTAVASPSLYPTAQLNRAATSVLRRHPEILTTFARRYGHPKLRAVLARRCAERGMPLEGKAITITHGCIEALNLALRAVCSKGDVVAVESPTFYGVLQALEAQGLQPLEIPTSAEHGISLDALEMALDTQQPPVRAVICMPTLHNPLGCSMSDANKQALVALCKRYQVPLIEDDIYAQTGPEQALGKPAKAWDSDGSVIYCSSLNKVLAPGMRLGWMAAGKWQARVEMLKYSQSRYIDELNQLTAASFMESQAYDRYLLRFQAHLQQLRHCAAQAIERSFGTQVQVIYPSGGMMLWLRLPDDASALELSKRALEQGVLTAPGPMFSSKPRMAHFLRLSYGAVSEAQIENGIRILAQLLPQCRIHATLAKTA
ncbi:PLP-dependent aminotransferase family protein [Lampropedia puyangensis]|uniref:PLP-dependent aminotransferase family protein n=1 Tax=Lampropedia puyangensis TaxID=1330072 RepID=A0A4S8EZA3_9BURK|nr:PLP-dependent aminotransferase family protein [Lampropedia puyangensis]THT99033.1 PLP-dependent aminotransferase family protein [Lampropedia puyangensis]